MSTRAQARTPAIVAGLMVALGCGGGGQPPARPASPAASAPAPVPAPDDSQVLRERAKLAKLEQQVASIDTQHTSDDDARLAALLPERSPCSWKQYLYAEQPIPLRLKLGAAPFAVFERGVVAVELLSGPTPSFRLTSDSRRVRLAALVDPRDLALHPTEPFAIAGFVRLKRRAQLAASRFVDPAHVEVG